ncbi:MAG: tRNA pseudouridine synthase A [Deltaproteobacteria bacterium ADurb.Bin510]|nr:MAG: tRNA pseudouridine synthase A [Deltaproteobacteria bacterium ADurb.Bin510]
MTNQRNIKIILAYDGADYHGWQAQAHHHTVQGVLERTLHSILREPVAVSSSGRTDSGVHALAQPVNFRTANPIPLGGLQSALNAKLPADIRAVALEEVDWGFHARFDSKSKCYCYVIDTSPILSPLLARYVLHEPEPLDLKAMQQAARYILGEHDFRAFMASNTSIKTTVRTITCSELLQQGERLWYVIEGSGFLRHMVRNIVGTLLMVGKGECPPERVAAIIESCDRNQAGPTAPPQGLYLVGVKY